MPNQIGLKLSDPYGFHKLGDGDIPSSRVVVPNNESPLKFLKKLNKEANKFTKDRGYQFQCILLAEDHQFVIDIFKTR
jgi:hypothetical protein